jgi:hypothetical protein
MTNPFFVVKNFATFDDERVRDLLVGAFEGGSNYWYMIESYDYGGGYGPADFVPGGRAFIEGWAGLLAYMLPFVEGCSLLISSPATDDDSERKMDKLDRAALQKGLALMAKNYGFTHYADFVNENDDANTADVFLQLSLFGEVIFG